MVRLSKNLRSITDADGGVILDVERGQIFRCNATGAIILELLTRGVDETQLASQFGKLCQCPPTCASNDVQEFLATLSRLGLLERPTSTRIPR
jgi:coenzyme PQQ synthesis protein D (PqqD)